MIKNDLTLYDRLSETWWTPGAVFNQLQDFNPLRLSYFQEMAGPFRGKSILDVGCGGGILAEEFARDGAQVTGIDLSRASIDQAQRHARIGGLTIDYQVADAADMPLPAASFELVVASEVLEHVPDLEGTLREVSRVLKPEGLFLFDTPNRTWVARLALIGVGERLFSKIPKGTHDGKKFIRPAELGEKLRRVAIDLRDIRGFLFSGTNSDGHHRFRFSRTTALAYFGYGVRR